MLQHFVIRMTHKQKSPIRNIRFDALHTPDSLLDTRWGFPFSATYIVMSFYLFFPCHPKLMMSSWMHYFDQGSRLQANYSHEVHQDFVVHTVWTCGSARGGAGPKLINRVSRGLSTSPTSPTDTRPEYPLGRDNPAALLSGVGLDSLVSWPRFCYILSRTHCNFCGPTVLTIVITFVGPLLHYYIHCATHWDILSPVVLAANPMANTWTGL